MDDNEGVPGSGPASGGDNEGKTEMEAGDWGKEEGVIGKGETKRGRVG